MKKALLLLLVFAGAYHVKAQQFYAPKTADSLSPGTLNKYDSAHPANQPGFFKPYLKPNQSLSSLTFKPLQLRANGFTDHMPVAILSGNSRMAVVKLSGYSKMPVANMSRANNQQTIPKIFKTP